MNFDISPLLDQWDYQPGEMPVRRFKGKDGVEKVQLRMDLGLLQMNIEGRPDGKRPMGFDSRFDYHLAQWRKHRDAHNGEEAGFRLNADDCAKLQQEAIQYHHRYICLYQLEDYDGVMRDTERNLAVFDFVTRFAQTEELAWALLQFRPQLLMMHTRAKGNLELKKSDFAAAITVVEAGLDAIRHTYQASPHPELAEQSGEIASLEEWLKELRAKRPLSERERLEKALSEAVGREDYEKAAQVRDALRKIGIAPQ